MTTRNDRTDRRRSRGTPVDVVTGKKKRERAPEGQHGQVVPPTREAIREAIEAGKCPWCGRGPYQLLAGHTNKKHGISHIELRDLAGVPLNASICSPEYSERKREEGRRRGAIPTPKDRARSKPRISKAAREVLRANGLRFTAEERSAAGKIGGPIGGAARGAQLKKPRDPCAVCGAVIPYVSGKTQWKTCSPECRRVHKSRVAAAGRAKRRSDTCKNGHPLSGANLKVVSAGNGAKRICRECQRIYRQAYKARRRASSS